MSRKSNFRLYRVWDGIIQRCCNPNAKNYHNYGGKLPKYTGYALSASDVAIAVENAPTVDAVPVVRCKDCRYSYDDMGGLCCSHGVCVDCVVPEDFFCRYGKRKGGDE